MDTNRPSPKLNQLTKFALLLSSALPEDATVPVIGINHDVELSNCFSPNGFISCPSLCLHGQNSSEGSSTAMQTHLASLNMNSPIYTSSSPSSVSSTPKTLLINVIQSMQELIESRLSRMILHLLKTGDENSRVVAHLVSPSRNAIKICTVVTRFESTNEPIQYKDEETDMIFKAVLDVKIFGQVTTVEMICPVTFQGKFDDNATVSAGGEQSEVPLLSCVEIKFNCSALLQEMIGRARMLTKKAVKEAAALSIKILRITPKNGGNADSSCSTSASGGNSGNVGLTHGSGDIGVSNGTARDGKTQDVSSAGGLFSNDNLGALAAALKLGPQQGTLGTNSGSNSLNSNGSSGLLAAALKSGARPAQQQFNSNADMLAAVLKGVDSTSKPAPMPSLLGNSSFGLLNANSTASFGSIFGSLGNLRNDTFTNLLKSSNSLKNLANADWGLNQGGNSAALLQNNVSARGANAEGNSNATFDFGNTSGTSASAAQARNLLLGLAGAGESDGGMSNNSTAAKISNCSIDAMKNIVRVQDQANSHPSISAVAGLNPSQGQDSKQEMLNKLQEMIQTSSTAAGSISNSQYGALRDFLLKRRNGSPQASTNISLHQPRTNAQATTNQEEVPDSSKNYQGLFSWIENDSMFLTEDKLKEQDCIAKKKEQESRKKPMPRRFFSSAEDGNLESVGQSLFEEKKRKSKSKDGASKKKRA